MNLHNFSTVVGFEAGRALTRRSFWVATLAVPLLMILLFGLSFLSGASAASADDAASREKVAFTYTDGSGLISPAVAEAAGGRLVRDAASAQAEVVAGRSDAHVDYPADPSQQPITVAARDLGMTQNGRYESVARRVLVDSAREKVGDPTVASILTTDPTVDVATYVDGARAPGIGAAILPGLFLVLFYLVILMLGNQMLNITVEEKENRVTEMILTTIKPSTLIIGKVVALVLVGIVQMLAVTVPMFVLTTVYGLMNRGASPGGIPVTPSFNGSPLVFAPGPFIMGLLLFLGGFLLFTGMLVAIGSVMPNAKEAGSAFGAVIIVLFLPFYAFGFVMSSPRGVFSQVLTFFPLTAPVTALMRNAFGTLSVLEGVGVLVIVFAFAALFLALGVQLFRAGSISYDARLDLRKAFGKRGLVR